MIYQSSTCIENNQTMVVFCLRHDIHSPKDVSMFGPFQTKPLVHLGVYPKFILVLKKTMDFS